MEDILETPELEIAEPVEQVAEETPVEGEALETPEIEAEPVEVKGDERLLPAWIRAMKQSDPAGFRQAKGMFFGHRSFEEKLKDFDLDGTKAFFDEHGGRESLAETLTNLQGQAQELASIREMLAQGNAGIVQQMVEASPEGFTKIAPSVLNAWAQNDPDGYSQAIFGVVSNVLAQSGVNDILREVSYMLKYNDAAGLGESLRKMQETLGSFGQLAQAPRQQPQGMKGDPKLQEREQQLAQREQQIFTTDFQRDVDGFRQPAIEQQLATFIARSPNDAEKKELAVQTVRSQVIQRLAADKDYQQKLNAFTARRDKEGALRLVKSRETTAINEIAPKVGRTIFGQPVAAKPTAVATPKAAPSIQRAKPAAPKDKYASIFDRIAAR